MSEMQSAFDPRSRFVILWVLAETWFPLLVAVASPLLVGDAAIGPLRILSFLAPLVAALGQMLLLRGHVGQTWLWPLAGLGTAALFHVFFNIVAVGLFGGILPERGGGLAQWMPYFLLSGLIAGLALALPQALVVARWRLGAGGWILVVLGAAILASAIGGVIWVMGGMGAASAEQPENWPAVISVVARHVASGGIVGVWLWRCLQLRSVDAAPPVP